MKKQIQLKKKKKPYACRGKKGGCYFHGEIIGQTKLRIAA